MRNRCPKPINRKGVTYYPCYCCARSQAEKLKLKSIRLVPYSRGWAIQREVSGPYFNATSGTFDA